MLRDYTFGSDQIKEWFKNLYKLRRCGTKIASSECGRQTARRSRNPPAEHFPKKSFEDQMIENQLSHFFTTIQIFLILTMFYILSEEQLITTHKTIKLKSFLNGIMYQNNTF